MLLHQAAEDLALAVTQQWRAEERLHRLHDPFPLPVHWTTADAMVADHWDNIHMQSTEKPLNFDGQLADIAVVFDKVPSRRLVVLGRPGAGKSILVLRFTLDFLERRQAGEPVPAIFLLASWDPRQQSLHEWMSSRLAADYPALGASAPSGHMWAWELVRAGLVLPVLDGLDEIPESLRGEAIRHLNATLDRTSPVVLTCRAEEYRDTVKAADVLTAGAVIELQPLSLDDLAAYLPRTGRQIRRQSADQPTTKWGPVLAYIREKPDERVALTLLEVLSTPLMTSMARAAYSDTAADPACLLEPRFADPDALEEHLLDAFVPAVYSYYPTAPDTTSVQYRQDQAREWLSWIACHLSQLGTRDLAWWQLGDAIPRRTRGVLAALTCSLAMGLVMNIAAGPRVGLAYGIPYGLGCGLVHGMGRRPGPSYVEFRFRGTAKAFLRRLAIGLATGLGVGLAFGLPPAAVLTEGLAFGIVVPLHVWLDIPADVTRVSSPSAVLAKNRTATLAFGLSFTLLFGLSAGFTYIFASAHASGPDIGPFMGVQFGLSFGLAGIVGGALTGWLAAGRIGAAAYGIASGIAVGCVFPPASSVAIGLALGAMFGLVVGFIVMLPRAWGTFVFSQVWLALRCQLPWQLMKFLADAHRRGVLRQAGGVYQFRHARLQDHLAGHSASGKAESQAEAVRDGHQVMRVRLRASRPSGRWGSGAPRSLAFAP